MERKTLFKLSISIETKSTDLTERQAEGVKKRLEHFIQALKPVRQASKARIDVGYRYDEVWQRQYPVTFGHFEMELPSHFIVGIFIDMFHRFCLLNNMELTINQGT
jgi:hypothetical protein